MLALEADSTAKQRVNCAKHNKAISIDKKLPCPRAPALILQYLNVEIPGVFLIIDFLTTSDPSTVAF